MSLILKIKFLRVKISNANICRCSIAINSSEELSKYEGKDKLSEKDMIRNIKADKDPINPYYFKSPTLILIMCL